MEKVDLLPCPFCGSVNLNEFQHYRNIDDGLHKCSKIQCLECGGEAIKSQWNTRPAPQTAALQEAIDALEFYAKHEHWMAVTSDPDCLSLLLVAMQGSGGSGYRVAEVALEIIRRKLC